MFSRFGAVAVMVLLSSTAAFSQHLSYGVIAGTALTDDFSSFYLSSPGGFTTSLSPGGRSAIVGPMLEWSFTQDLSFEVDGLFRELHYGDAQGRGHNPTVTWEFPVLAKYRLLSSRTQRPTVRPFAEAGPSFRTTGNLNSNPSHVGISAGAGFESRFQQLNIEPTIRFTRWESDSRPNGLQARPDQIEVLLGLSRTATSDVRPFGKRLSAGVLLGSDFFGDFNTTSSTSTNVTTGSQTTFSSRSGPRGLLVGPAAEFRATQNFSLEMDALYRPIREHYTTSGISAGQAYSQSRNSAFVSWEFPMLVKYDLPLHVPGSVPAPFVETGPSLRIPDSVTHSDGLPAAA